MENIIENSNSPKPQKKQRGVKTVFSGLRQCSSATGISYKILKEAKKRNGPGFRTNGTVDWKTAEPYITANMLALSGGVTDSVDGIDYKKMKEKYDALSAQLSYEELINKYVTKEEAAGIVKKFAKSANTMLISRLVNEAPTKLYGLSIPDITKFMEALVTDVCKCLQKITFEQ